MAPRKNKKNTLPTREERKREHQAGYRAALRELDDPTGTHRPLGGRPITDNDMAEILEIIASGRSANSACRELGVSVSVFGKKIRNEPQWAASHTRARELQAMSRFERMIARTDALNEIDETEDGAQVLLGIAKHQHEADRWLLSKLHPAAFGDKTTTVLEGNPDAPVAYKDLTEMSTEEKVTEFREHLKRGRT